MAIVYADNVLPETSGIAENLNLGAAGDTVTLPAGVTLKTNKIMDAGGNNIITSDGSGNLTVDSQLSGSFALISTNTITNAASSAFTTGFSDKKVYMFSFSGMKPATDGMIWTCQFSSDGGSTYSTTITSTSWRQYHNNDGSSGGMGYITSSQQSQGTSYQALCESNTPNVVGNVGGEALGGFMYLFNPSSTTYVKHFYSTVSYTQANDRNQETWVGGYCNTTSAINAVNFKFSSGNITSGTIKLYGL